ncbi:hypothetical protein BJX99DRAFT_265390 [Aspergillus californicus]
MSALPEAPLGAQPAADFACLFDEAGIPNILWGLFLVTLLGGEPQDNESCIPIRVSSPPLRNPRRTYSDQHPKQDIEFVIPDDKIDLAINTITTSGLQPCTDTECRARDLPATAHFHFTSPYEYPNKCQGILTLHKQSYLLWWLPSGPPIITLAPPTPDDRTLMLTTDTAEPWTGLYAVKTFTPWVFVDALVFLMCRDMYTHPQTYEWWSGWLDAFIGLNADYRERLRGLIDPRVREYWDARHGYGDELWHCDVLHALRLRLVEEGGLGLF